MIKWLKGKREVDNFDWLLSQIIVWSVAATYVLEKFNGLQ